LGLICIWAYLCILGPSRGFWVCGFFWEGSSGFGGRFLGLGCFGQVWVIDWGYLLLFGRLMGASVFWVYCGF
jgi:hypothetical protein